MSPTVLTDFVSVGADIYCQLSPGDVKLDWGHQRQGIVITSSERTWWQRFPSLCLYQIRKALGKKTKYFLAEDKTILSKLSGKVIEITHPFDFNCCLFIFFVAVVFVSPARRHYGLQQSRLIVVTLINIFCLPLIRENTNINNCSTVSHAGAQTDINLGQTGSKFKTFFCNPNDEKCSECKKCY